MLSERNYFWLQERRLCVKHGSNQGPFRMFDLARSLSMRRELTYMYRLLSFAKRPYSYIENGPVITWYIITKISVKIRNKSDVQITFSFTIILYVHRSFIPNKTTYTKYCLTQWISKLTNFKVPWNTEHGHFIASCFMVLCIIPPNSRPIDEILKEG